MDDRPAAGQPPTETAIRNSATLLHSLRQSQLLAIVRSVSERNAETILCALIESGVSVIEVSLTTPGAVGLIEKYSSTTSVAIGAGTVLTAQQTREVSDAGARFIVTPAMTESIEVAVEQKLPTLVGVMTPTEALEAMNRGATALKLFPADIGGPAFLRAVSAPLPQLEWIPVGGVTIETAADYLDAGILALGAGTPLTGRPADQPDPKAISSRVTAYQRIISDFQTTP